MSAFSIFGAKQLFQYVELFSLFFLLFLILKIFRFVLLISLLAGKTIYFLNNKFCSKEGRIVSKKTLGTESKIF